MDKKHIINQLNDELAEVRLLFDGMDMAELIPMPILELAKKKTSRLSKLVEQLIESGSSVLVEENNYLPSESDQKITQPVIEVPQEPEAPKIAVENEIDIHSDIVLPEDKTEIATDPSVVTHHQHSENKSEVANHIDRNEAYKKLSKKPSLGDTLNHGKHYVSDNFAAKPDSLSQHLESQPIDDLYKSINLNDRYRFIRELFDGDGTRFLSTIDRIQQAKNPVEAEAIAHDAIKGIRSAEIVQEFLNLIKRLYL